MKKIDWATLQPIEVPLLPEGMYFNSQGQLQVDCSSCGRPTDWDEPAYEYDGRAWCGGSPRCCP